MIGRAAVNDTWKLKNGAKKIPDFDVYLNYVPTEAKKKLSFKKINKFKATKDKSVTKIGQDLLINLMNKYEQN